MIWEIIVGLLLIIVLLDITTLIKPKPTFKSQLKRTFNTHWLMIGMFAPIGANLLMLGGYVGCQMVSQHSNYVYTIIVMNGLAWTFLILMWGILISFFWDLLYSWKKKKKSEYYAWVDKIDKEGVIKYTAEERAYFEAKDKEAKEKLKKRFPFFVKLAKLVDKQKVV